MVSGLQIVSSTATEDYVDVTFNRPIDLSTFTPQDISLLPNGSLALEAWQDLCGVVYDVALAGNYAYAATPEGLTVLDLSNPADVHGVANVRVEGGGAAQIAVQGDRLYVAAAYGNLQIYSIADPTAPSLLGTCERYNWPRELVVAGDFAFIAGGSDGVQIYNVADPSAPYLLSTYSTPDAVTGLTLVGNRAYLACGSAGMLILDISDATAPSLLGSYDTPDTARTISVAGDLAYVADTYSLQILNVADPTSPSLVGSVTLYGGALAVGVTGDWAYVTDGSGMQIFNVADPTSPVFVGRCDTIRHSGSVYMPGDQVVTLAGDLAFLMNGTGLQIFSLTDPAAPAPVGAYDAPTSANSVSVVGNKVYLATPNAGLQIFDLTDPATPLWLGGGTSAATGVVVVGNRVYSTSGVNLYIFDYTDPAAPIRLVRYRTPGYQNLGLSASGDLLCIASGDAGVRIFNVANPTAPVLLASYDTPGFANGVSLVGNRLYVADGDQLLVLDVSDPTAPSLLASWAMPNGATAVDVSGDLAYVTGNSGVQVYDIRDLAAPTLVASYATPQAPTGICVAGERIYLSMGTTLQILHNLTAVDSVTQVGQATYRLHLETSLPEGYTLTIFPQIADSEGALLDQDQDGVAGEYPDDALRVTYAPANSAPTAIALSASVITEKQPVGTVVGEFPRQRSGRGRHVRLQPGLRGGRRRQRFLHDRCPGATVHGGLLRPPGEEFLRDPRPRHRCRRPVLRGEFHHCCDRRASPDRLGDAA